MQRRRQKGNPYFLPTVLTLLRGSHVTFISSNSNLAIPVTKLPPRFTRVFVPKFGRWRIWDINSSVSQAPLLLLLLRLWREEDGAQQMKVGRFLGPKCEFRPSLERLALVFPLLRYPSIGQRSHSHNCTKCLLHSP